MITMLTARIAEIDDVDIAIEALKRQIDLNALKKNSGGIIFCHMDFIESGIAAAICRALPFDIIGMTTLASANQDSFGLFELTLTVLTSDEVTFTAGMTNTIDEFNYRGEIDHMFQTMRAGQSQDPSLILTFMPYVHEVSGAEIVSAMDCACHGIPMWGSITNSFDFTYESVQTICNGNTLRGGVAMMFLTGPVEAKFIVASIPERKIHHNRAIITKSAGAVIYEVNDTPILEHLKNIGLVINKENITTTPLMVYYDESEVPVALGFYTLFEDGSVLTGGEMPQGTSFAVGSIDAEGIFESAQEGLSQITRVAHRNATLLLPCITRYIMLAPDQEAELRLIQEKLTAGGHPYMMGYSGGEICPVPDQNGTLRNRFHNYTFCACIL